MSQERRILSSELSDSKEYSYKLEVQLSRMENSTQILAETENLKSEINRMRVMMDQKKLESEQIEKKYQLQQKEIETLNRSLDACLFYQVAVSISLYVISKGYISLGD
jgi:hypothetical protein